jgi:hypothetical protein
MVKVEPDFACRQMANQKRLPMAERIDVIPNGSHRRVTWSAVIANRIMSYFEVRPRAAAASLSPEEAAGPLIGRQYSK